MGLIGEQSMLATDRLFEVIEKFGKSLQRVVPVELDDETIQVVLYLNDGTNLRVTEQWDGHVLKRYSYYWLTRANELKVGWDNAPHHIKLERFPHHKHIDRSDNPQPSLETCLEDVMGVILQKQI